MMREDKEIPISAPPTELEPIFKQSATDINKSAGDSSCSEGMSKSTKKSPIRCVGLNNIGNTCFMYNASEIGTRSYNVSSTCQTSTSNSCRHMAANSGELPVPTVDWPV